MPSVLDQKFKHTLLLDSKYRNEIELYCRQEIGYRTYFMNRYRGGKQWRISNTDSYQAFASNKFEVSLNDDSHATVLALKYAA